MAPRAWVLLRTACASEYVLDVNALVFSTTSSWMDGASVPMTTVPFSESIFALSFVLRMRLTIHRSALSRSIPSFSARTLMSMHWWMRQYVSKMKRRAFSLKSSLHPTRKKSLASTSSHALSFACAPSKS